MAIATPPMPHHMACTALQHFNGNKVRTIADDLWTIDAAAIRDNFTVLGHDLNAPNISEQRCFIIPECYILQQGNDPLNAQLSHFQHPPASVMHQSTATLIKIYALLAAVDLTCLSVLNRQHEALKGCSLVNLYLFPKKLIPGATPVSILP
ncbi:hypothetical protein BDK51DRAFT_35066 [Blyttiomyces helicus]|uniref:Uncharacterized protein n=1 Tax=Blyttiomyces helicus TaxID=388810 RepID=A0A4P9WNP2_9FUNG|nr:hypothetical protein BDK51DRAFT_35066 [Blyttiomyces helicus]|eukprot:RKO94749.1 hypothetical protein BDK51DRAFT_35066 [Blyttiomyces helicus]